MIHISKFMELGKGQWKDKVDDLYALRDRFIHHMENYSRIFQLRYFRPITNSSHFYELVEIPKALLDEARTGTFEIFLKSKQDPKPGVCRVIDQEGVQKFELYFDGGSERKLQIRGLRRNLCMSHATWSFREVETLSSVTDAEPFGNIPV
ncbi:MAG: hypothetical protein AMXMBFR67_24660 [Nitrospira sp.]